MFTIDVSINYAVNLQTVVQLSVSFHVGRWCIWEITVVRVLFPVGCLIPYLPMWNVLHPLQPVVYFLLGMKWDICWFYHLHHIVLIWVRVGCVIQCQMHSVTDTHTDIQTLCHAYNTTEPYRFSCAIKETKQKWLYFRNSRKLYC